jgi:hypothetical protein
MVPVCLGLHPSAVARFVTWRLQGLGTDWDTNRRRNHELRLLKLMRLRVAIDTERYIFSSLLSTRPADHDLDKSDTFERSPAFLEVSPCPKSSLL